MIHLKQITVRGIPLDIEKMIKREAGRKGLSLNKAFISLLEKTTATKQKAQKRKSLYHDLDHVCGIWTKKEAEQFTNTVEFQRTIDEGLWKKAKS